MRLVDSHVHLDDPKFAADFDQVLERAAAAGVDRMMAIGTGGGPPALDTAVRLAERHACLLATVGVHPHDASKATPESFARLRELARHPKVAAIGEIGLDYHYDLSPREVQRRVFERQLEIAVEAGKPIVIHTREAWDDTMELLRREAPAPVRGIMHCFTGDARQAQEALDYGFHLAFGGVITFHNSAPLREVAATVPEDRLLLETDCPYLAPVPHRGKRNEPAFLVEIARRLAEARGVAVEEIARVTTANWERLCLPHGAACG